jgi:hypothetical protein
MSHFRVLPVVANDVTLAGLEMMILGNSGRRYYLLTTLTGKLRALK